MHQTLTGTKKKNKVSNNYSEGLRSGPIVPGFFFDLFGACAGLVHLVVYFGGGSCAGLVTLTSQNIDKQQKQLRNTTNISSYFIKPSVIVTSSIANIALMNFNSGCLLTAG